MTRRLCLLLLCLVGITASSGGRLGSVAAQAPGQAATTEITAEALAQIDALIREKDTRSPVDQKIDSQLLYELRMELGVPVADGVTLVETELPYAPDGHVIVDVKGSPTATLIASIGALGGEVISSAPEATMLRAHIDIGQVEALASLDDVIFVQPEHGAMVTHAPPRSTKRGFEQRAAGLRAFLQGAVGPTGVSNVVVTQTGQGSRSSEGDVTHLAFAARQAFGVNGTGIKIGVLSNGVTNLAVSQASGDLGPVTVLPGQAGTGDEGTAMLEIIHDLAPGADLYFATATSGIASFANNIRALRN